MIVIFLFMFLGQKQQAPNQQAPDERQRVHIGQGYGQGIGQGQGCQMPRVGDHLKLLAEKLNLSHNQQTRIRDILEDQLAQLEATRRDDTLSHKDRISKVRSLSEASASRLREALKDSQKQEFDEMRQKSGGDCSMIWIAVE